MSPELQVPLQPEIECAGQCSPSHRRARRALTGLAVLLLLGIIACTLYLAFTGGFNP